jgi:hypothetical protein
MFLVCFERFTIRDLSKRLYYFITFLSYSHFSILLLLSDLFGLFPFFLTLSTTPDFDIYRFLSLFYSILLFEVRNSNYPSFFDAWNGPTEFEV